MSLYLDTSCLLKVLFPESETSRVMQLIAAEEHVVISSLAYLEALVQIHARTAGGVLTRPAGRAVMERLDVLLRQEPYEVVHGGADAIELAQREVRRLSRRAHCPTLDRLHLGVMKSLALTRLLTNDDAQARAARALGFSVILPR